MATNQDWERVTLPPLHILVSQDQHSPALPEILKSLVQSQGAQHLSTDDRNMHSSAEMAANTRYQAADPQEHQRPNSQVDGHVTYQNSSSISCSSSPISSNPPSYVHSPLSSPIPEPSLLVGPVKPGGQDTMLDEIKSFAESVSGARYPTIQNLEKDSEHSPDCLRPRNLRETRGFVSTLTDPVVPTPTAEEQELQSSTTPKSDRNSVDETDSDSRTGGSWDTPTLASSSSTFTHSSDRSTLPESSDCMNISDAGYESETGSEASTSLESSVVDYVFENGRRYHRFREGLYPFPNDQAEQEREGMMHALLGILCADKLHHAPIGEHPQDILDLGTGTGVWAVEMADEYPSANVLGVDLSPIQPEWVPPNLKFLVDDFACSWLYPLDKFDYVHCRHLAMAVRDWSHIIRSSLAHLRPGGWIEIQEVNYTPMKAGGGEITRASLLGEYWRLVHNGLAAMGINSRIHTQGRLADALRATGFVNVTERIIPMPVGTWPRDTQSKITGLYARLALEEGLQATALGPLTRGLGWSRDEVELFLVDVRKALQEGEDGLYIPYHIICAQKPEAASGES